MVGTIKVGKLQAADGTGNTIAIESGHLIKQPGSVVQYVKDTGDTQITVAANAYGNTDTSITFTPKFSDSIIQIYWEGMFVKDANGAASVAYGIHKDDVLIHNVPADNGPYPYIHVKDETRVFTRLSMTATESAGNTNSRVYRCKFRGYSNAQSWKVNWTGDHSGTTAEEILIVMEIAQ